MNYPLFIFVTTLFVGITSTQTQANNNRDENKIKNIFGACKLFCVSSIFYK